MGAALGNMSGSAQMGDLDPEQQISIFRFCNPSDLWLKIPVVSQRWLQMVLDERLWCLLTEETFGITSSDQLVPDEHLTSTARVDSRRIGWRRLAQFNMRAGLSLDTLKVEYSGSSHKSSAPPACIVSGPMFEEACNSWSRIKGWCAEQAPAIIDTLNAAATSEVCSDVESWNVLPGGLRAIYGIHNGQTKADSNDQESFFTGLIGGYSFYNHFVCTRLLSLADATEWTQKLHDQVPGFQDLHKSKLLIAASFRFDKLFFVDLKDCSMCIADHSLTTLIPCAPGSMLDWFSEYSHRLQNGTYRWSPLFPDQPETDGINLFPDQGEQVTVGTCSGIEVRSSAIYVPESPNAGWTYSLRLKLLPTSTEEERGFRNCQLHMRHWEITDKNGDVKHVSGEGVVGKMPVLRDGGYIDKGPAGDGSDNDGTFVYQSCSGEMDGGGTFGGRITLVPGEIDEREPGDDITLRVPAFPLSVPKYIY